MSSGERGDLRGSSVGRRELLRGGLVAGGALAALGAARPAASPDTAGPATTPAAPALVRSGRPQVTHGVQSGDPGAHAATVWARADRPSRLLVKIGGRVVRGPVVTPESDFTGKLRLTGLPAGADLPYQVRFADLDDPSLVSAPEPGRLRTAPGRRSRDVRLVWSADLAGQGWGSNPDIGGYRIFRTMAALDPDLFLFSGDMWYADNPIEPTVTLPDGRVWRNVTSDEKAKVAETLAEFRGQHKYNLRDDALRAFAAAVPQLNQWDDHEVLNNWYPGEIHGDARYTEKRVDVLAARARQALFEFLPISTADRVYRSISYGPLLEVFVLDMRTYKDANGPNNGPAGRVLGERQLRWLQRGLASSTATWKVIANTLPLALAVRDGAAAFEAVAQGDPGGPLGRESEIARLLSFIKRRNIDNVVWLTGDVHYTAAHEYDPARAAFTDFLPFWEFVSGPLNAGGFQPPLLDGTFGPQVRFQLAPPAANSPPLDGFQFFGEVAIDGESAELTVRLRDVAGAVRYSTRLAPAA
jgi:alkaline phosphatase D